MSTTKICKKKEVKGIQVNISEYARTNGISWNTAKRRLEGTKRKKRVAVKPSKLNDFMDVIINKLENYSCSATSIFYFIKEKGYDGSKSLVIKKVKELKTQLHKKATIRVETTPGLQGQVDWL